MFNEVKNRYKLRKHHKNWIVIGTTLGVALFSAQLGGQQAQADTVESNQNSQQNISVDSKTDALSQKTQVSLATPTAKQINQAASLSAEPAQNSVQPAPAAQNPSQATVDQNTSADNEFVAEQPQNDPSMQPVKVSVVAYYTGSNDGTGGTLSLLTPTLPAGVKGWGEFNQDSLNQMQMQTQNANSENMPITSIVFKNTLDTPIKIDSNITNLFANYPDVQTIDLSNVDVSAVTDFSRWFANTPSLKTIKFGDFNAQSGTDFSDMFDDSGLGELDLSSWRNVSKDANTTDIFNNMTGLHQLTLPGDLYLSYENGLPVRDNIVTVYDGGKKVSTDNDWVEVGDGTPDKPAGDVIGGGNLSWEYSTDGAAQDDTLHPTGTKTYVWKENASDPFTMTILPVYSTDTPGYDYYDQYAQTIDIKPVNGFYKVILPKEIKSGNVTATLDLTNSVFSKRPWQTVNDGQTAVYNDKQPNYVDNGDGTVTFFDPTIGPNSTGLYFAYKVSPVDVQYRLTKKDADGKLIPIPGQAADYTTYNGYPTQRFMVPTVTGYTVTEPVLDSADKQVAKVTSETNYDDETNSVVDNGYAPVSWKFTTATDGKDDGNVTVSSSDTDAYPNSDHKYTLVYSPDKQTIKVNFIDMDAKAPATSTKDADSDTNGLEAVEEKPDKGTVIDSENVDVVTDQQYKFDGKDLPAALAAKGYKYDSCDSMMTITPDETDSQTFNVYLKHDTKKDTQTKTVTRTINYVVSDHGVAAPKSVVETITFTKTDIVDAVTGDVITPGKWTTTDKFAAVTAPELAGYTADKTEIAVATATANDSNSTITVTYTKKASAGSDASSTQNGTTAQTATQTTAVAQPVSNAQATNVSLQERTLPKTGEQSPLALIGLGFISLVTALGGIYKSRH